MDELRDILLTHAQRYPLMEPTDAVKLIYQNEFGGGHMIRDVDACLAYLRREYEAVTPKPQAPQYEPIGNGIVRVHLAALLPEDLEALGQAFIRSAESHKGDLVRFCKKIEVLRDMTKEGVFAFDTDGLDAYLRDYQAAGYPVVSHSETFRNGYHPAYRIIKI